MAFTPLFIATLFATLFFGALFNPTMGILGYLSVYLFYDSSVWWCKSIAIYLSRPSLVASIFLFIGCLLHRDKIDWNISRREIQFYLFLGTAWLVSIAFGVGMHEASWGALEKITKMFIFIFLLLRVVHTLDGFKLLMWGYILGAIFLAYQAHDIGQFSGGRLEDMGGIDFREANAFALFMAFGITLLGFQLLKGAWWKKVLYVIAIAAMLDTIVLTQSRAAFLGMALACPYVLLSAPRKYRKRIYLCVTLGAVLFFMLSDVYFLKRMDTIGDEAEQLKSTAEKTNISRIDFWNTSIRIFADHPLGIGVWNFQNIVPYYDPDNPGLDAHNTYVLCYTEIGIIGIILFMVIIIEAFFQLRRIRQIVKGTPYEQEISLFAISLGTSLLIYVLGGFMSHSYLYNEITWMLLALPICLENATRKLVDVQGEQK